MQHVCVTFLEKKQLNVFLFVLPLLYTSFVLAEAHVHILAGSSDLLLNIHSSDVGFLYIAHCRYL